MISICENCKIRFATEMHHLFSQSKLNRKLYPDLIHHMDNIQFLCYSCHHDHAVKKWSEKEFCEHFKIEPRSKSGKQKKEYFEKGVED